MRLSDIARLSGRIFKTRRLRTSLTIAGIGIGIGAILFLVSFGYGLQNVLLSSIASSEQLLTLDVRSFNQDVLKLDEQIINRIQDIPNVKKIVPQLSVNGQVDFENLTGNTNINIVDSDYFSLSASEFIFGGAYTDNNVREAVVSNNMVRLFNLESPEQLLGQKVSLGYFTNNRGEVKFVESPKEWRIVGIVEDSGKSVVYLPTVSANEIVFDSYDVLKVVAQDSAYLEMIRGEILNLGLQVSSISDTIVQAKKIFRVIQIILGLFGVVALIVSAIGMFNTMTIALLERTQEIGIMKAIGASDYDVWALFLSESVIMGFLGGVTGIVMGFVGAKFFNFGLNLLAQSLGGSSLDLFATPLWFVFTIVILSVFVGFLTGLYPSWRAAKLSPLDALRYK